MRLAAFGLVALVCTGCASGMASMASNGNGNGNGYGSPATYEEQKCEGVFGTATGVCEAAGD